MTHPVITRVIDVCVNCPADLQQEMKRVLQDEANKICNNSMSGDIRLVSTILLAQHLDKIDLHKNTYIVYTFLVIWEWN